MACGSNVSRLHFCIATATANLLLLIDACHTSGSELFTVRRAGCPGVTTLHITFEPCAGINIEPCALMLPFAFPIRPCITVLPSSQATTLSGDQALGEGADEVMCAAPLWHCPELHLQEPIRRTVTAACLRFTFDSCNATRARNRGLGYVAVHKHPHGGCPSQHYIYALCSLCFVGHAKQLLAGASAV